MLKAYYQISTYKKNEKLKKKYPKKLSRSFVKQFLQHLYTKIANTGFILNIDGVSKENRANYFFDTTGWGGDGCSTDRSGYAKPYAYESIQVGTGTNAVSTTDYCLQANILHGSSAGQLEQIALWTSNLTFSGSTGSFDIEKLFYNSSGSPITIEELGIYNAFAYSKREWMCSIRDVLGASHVEVLAGEYLKVKYTIQITA